MREFQNLVQFSTRKFFRILLWFVVCCVCDVLSIDFEPGGKPQIKLINPDAEIIIGSALNIRERGSGLFACGERSREGVLKADILKWTIDELNKKLWSSRSANVSLGFYMMDSCDRLTAATAQLVDFLPELRFDPNSNGTNLPFKFCLIDDVGLKNEADIKKTLEDINFPVIETSVNTNSPQNLAKAVSLFLRELNWDRFAIIHGSSEFGSAFLKLFKKAMKESDFCVSRLVNVDDTDQAEIKSLWSSRFPVVSLLSTEEHESLLNLLQNDSSIENKTPILFADLITRNQLKMIPANSIQIYSVVPYPGRDSGFESYYSKNSIGSGMRTEDELDLIERTKTIRTLNAIGEKLSEILRNAIKSVCFAGERLCSRFLGTEGRNAVGKFFAKSDWVDGEQWYQLVEYQFQFPDGHVHLHKVMAFSSLKNLEIFEKSIPLQESICDGENEFLPECRCLKMKADRTESARNIDDWSREKQRSSKNALSSDKNPSGSVMQDVSQSLHKPMVFAALNDPLNGTLACLTVLGGLVTLIIAQYFATFAALPNGGLTSGTSIIGYVILIGLFFLYSSNLTFLLTPLVSTCIVRRFAVSFSYAMIFSGMLIKVRSSFRGITSDKLKNQSPWKFLAYSAGFTLIQGLISGVWLLMKPPATEFRDEKWICYPPDGLDPHLILSMIYPFIILLATIILGIRTCSKSNDNEARWILISSSLVAIILSCWAVAVGTGVWQIHRTPCTNLASATIILVCLYIPKIKMHSKLKKNLRAQSNSFSLPADIDKECSVYATSQPPQYPLVFGYNMGAPAPVIPEDIIEPSYINQAYSLDESSETASTPFDSSSYSELEQENHTFSTFLDNSQVTRLEQEEFLNDPTQMIPSSLYPLDMFNIEPVAITSDHCQPGTNEFTPPHRATSQLYLCPGQAEWAP